MLWVDGKLTEVLKKTYGDDFIFDVESCADIYHHYPFSEIESYPLTICSSKVTSNYCTIIEGNRVEVRPMPIFEFELEFSKPHLMSPVCFVLATIIKEEFLVSTYWEMIVSEVCTWTVKEVKERLKVLPKNLYDDNVPEMIEDIFEKPFHV